MHSPHSPHQEHPPNAYHARRPGYRPSAHPLRPRARARPGAGQGAGSGTPPRVHLRQRPAHRLHGLERPRVPAAARLPRPRGPGRGRGRRRHGLRSRRPRAHRAEHLELPHVRRLPAHRAALPSQAAARRARKASANGAAARHRGLRLPAAAVADRPDGGRGGPGVRRPVPRLHAAQAGRTPHHRHRAGARAAGRRQGDGTGRGSGRFGPARDGSA